MKYTLAQLLTEPMPRQITKDKAVMPCPQCVEDLRGYAKIGTHRTECRTCNRYNQRARRKRLKLLPEILSQEQLTELRKAAEIRAYLEMFGETEWAAKAFKNYLDGGKDADS